MARDKSFLRQAFGIGSPRWYAVWGFIGAVAVLPFAWASEAELGADGSVDMSTVGVAEAEAPQPESSRLTRIPYEGPGARRQDYVDVDMDGCMWPHPGFQKYKEGLDVYRPAEFLLCDENPGNPATRLSLLEQEILDFEELTDPAYFSKDHGNKLLRKIDLAIKEVKQDKDMSAHQRNSLLEQAHTLKAKCFARMDEPGQVEFQLNKAASYRKANKATTHLYLYLQAKYAEVASTLASFGRETAPYVEQSVSALLKASDWVKTDGDMQAFCKVMAGKAAGTVSKAFNFFGDAAGQQLEAMQARCDARPESPNGGFVPH